MWNDTGAEQERLIHEEEREEWKETKPSIVGGPESGAFDTHAVDEMSLTTKHKVGEESFEQTVDSA